MTDYVIGIDLGGTRLRAALMDDDLNILQRHEVLTLAHEGFDATFGRVQQVIRAVMPAETGQVRGIGLSIPGPVNPFRGVVELGTNLAGWHDVHLGELLRQHFDRPIYLGNDANVAVLAEATRGAATGCRHVIFLTISTGIGSGMIVDGRMLLGSEGIGAEAGHMILVVDGQVSTLEKEAAGPALARRARAAIEAGEATSIREMVHGQLDQISGKTVGQAAMAGDALALRIVQRAGHMLGYGVITLLQIFNPEIVVFGGGVTTVGELLFAPMREAIEKHSIDRAYHRSLRYERAALGENVSLIGAGALVITRGGVEEISAVRARLDA